MKHKDSGWRCAVLHYDEKGNKLPQCIMCEYCRKDIRPERMNDECPSAPNK